MTKTKTKTKTKRKNGSIPTDIELRMLPLLLLRQEFHIPQRPFWCRCQIGDFFINFLIAGRDTTACALSWFFYEMALNPDIESQVLAEVDHVTILHIFHLTPSSMHIGVGVMKWNGCKGDEGSW
jgi:hypothetical protein